MERKPYAYRLTPVCAPQPGDPPSLVSAAVMTCMASGKTLSGNGGGGDYLSPETVDALRYNGHFKLVVEEEDFRLQAKELVSLRRQNQDLVEANNLYLERARRAEQVLATLERKGII